MNFSMYAGFTDMVRREGIEKAAAYAAGLGFSSVEIFDNCMEEGERPFGDASTAEKAREILARYGLTVACYSAFVSAWQREDSVQRAIEALDIVKALECPYFHHTLLPWIPVPEYAPEFQQGIKAAVTAAERIAVHAGRFGITCLYEDQGHYINGVKGFGLFFEEMRRRCKNVGVCADLGNILFVGEKPEEFLKVYLPYVRHVHIKDYLRQESETSPGAWWITVGRNQWLCDTIVGNGVVDVVACIKLLRENGYEGAYALEIGHPEPFEEGVRRAMELCN